MVETVCLKHAEMTVKMAIIYLPVKVTNNVRLTAFFH